MSVVFISTNYFITSKMTRIRKNKMKHDRLRTGKKKSNVMCMFNKMLFYIHNNNTEEERLIELLNYCSNKVLQHTGITGDYLLNYACSRARFDTLLLFMYELYPSYATERQVYWPDNYPLPKGISKRLQDIISTLIIGVAYLIENLDCYGETALFHACRNNQVQLVKLLLSHNLTDTNHQDGFGMTAFHHCCDIPNNELILLFLNNNDVDFEVEDKFNKYTAFDTYFASTSNVHVESYIPSNHGILVEFAKKYSSIFNNDKERKTNVIHLHIKERWDDFYAFDYLLNNEYADKMINQKDLNGNTPFHYACEWTSTDHYRKLLLQPGLLLNARNDNGRTPFHFACCCLNNLLIEDLITNPNVNENVTDNQGANGLHCMIEYFISNYAFYQRLKPHYMNSVHILLQRNPFLVTVKNNSGETPIDYAVKFHSLCSGDGYVVINRKRRQLLPHYTAIDGYWWSTLVSVLQDYHTETKNLMYNYFMETLTNHTA